MLVGIKHGKKYFCQNDESMLESMFSKRNETLSHKNNLENQISESKYTLNKMSVGIEHGKKTEANEITATRVTRDKHSFENTTTIQKTNFKTKMNPAPGTLHPGSLSELQAILNGSYTPNGWTSTKDNSSWLTPGSPHPESLSELQAIPYGSYFEWRFF